MYRGIPLQPPLFELGLKGYLYGRRALELAREAGASTPLLNTTLQFYDRAEQEGRGNR